MGRREKQNIKPWSFILRDLGPPYTKDMLGPPYTKYMLW